MSRQEKPTPCLFIPSCIRDDDCDRVTVSFLLQSFVIAGNGLRNVMRRRRGGSNREEKGARLKWQVIVAAIIFALPEPGSSLRKLAAAPSY
ncbi:hypothetical protein MRX96_011327 [Rhipicephalus microplus]